MSRVFAASRPAGRLLRLAPALVPVAVLSIAAVIDAVSTSLGLGASSSGRGATVAAYRSLFASPGFWPALGFSLWVAIVGTAVSVVVASLVGFAWIHRPGRQRRVQLWMFQLNLSLPHLVWATALTATLSQSGWLARLSASVGLIHRPGQFPVLVNDTHGLGIIAHLVSKEVPFVAVALLPLLGRRLQLQLRQASTLGAAPVAQFRHVYLPAVAPALVPAALAVFAFALGGYEPSAVLGVRQPRTLAVVIIDRFRDPNLARRSEAFALSVVLLAATALFGIGLWLLVGRSLSRARPTVDTAELVLS